MIWEVRISYKPGVQDAEGESALKGLKVLGFDALEEVRFAKVYRIKGEYDESQIEMMCKRLLANPVSQDYVIKKIEEK